MNKYLLRVDEAATLLSVSRWTIYRWVQEGRLEATKIGKGSLRIFRTSVAALIEHNRILSGELIDCHNNRLAESAPDNWSTGHGRYDRLCSNSKQVSVDTIS